jgi:hypothetical protein
MRGPRPPWCGSSASAVVRAALALAATLAAVAPAAAGAAGPRVHVMVVGRSDLLLAPRTVAARAVTVRASGKRCGVAAGTPLAALAGARRAGGPSFAVRDFGGACTRSARDGGALFVTRVGPNRNRGRNGWTYKVGARSGTAGAADPAGPFGSGRLRPGARVTWFWCRLARSGSCQRTLAVSARSTVARGGRLRVVVRGYDDFGHGRRIRGARVRLGGRSAVTGPHGVAWLRAPSRSGRVRLTATGRGLVRAFDRRVRVG